jgi:uncharacterized membrane protein
MTDDKLTRMLGWASVGLGAPLLTVPGRSAQALGIEDGPRQRAAVTAVGVRELVAAAGLLGQRKPAWLWARVAGDLMDLALLGNALANRAPSALKPAVASRVLKPAAVSRVLKSAARDSDQEKLSRTAAATAAVAVIAAVDLYAAVTRSRRSAGRGRTLSLTAAVTVARPREEAYARWRQLDDLPAFMAHLDSVVTTGPRTSHWRATAPFGKTVEWDAQVTTDIPGERLGWRSLDGSAVRNEGEVRFRPAPGSDGAEPSTEVHVTLRYSVPAGKAGSSLARYFGEEPHQQLDDDLRRFKQVLETGEVVRSEGAPGGKRARGEFPQHPARPLTVKELKEVRS